MIASELRSLQFCGSGGAPLPVEVANRFVALTGCKLNEGWGMTETSPTGTLTPVHGMRKAGSCGMPQPGIELKFESLTDPDDEAAPGEAGELCIRGPNVMKGYWKNEAATAQSMTRDGFFRSGDVAKMDSDGFVFIVDRTNDMLLCGGFNVYPRVIEEAIYEHASVEEVCVIGIPDDYHGQSPKAFIKLKKDSPVFTLDALKDFLKDRIGKHEMVQAMELRASCRSRRSASCSSATWSRKKRESAGLSRRPLTGADAWPPRSAPPRRRPRAASRPRAWRVP